jgi:hypothetical protein
MYTKFQTMEEIKEYFNHEKITCLLCYREFRGLYTHIVRVHKMSPFDYKIKYGIPLGMGLVGAETKTLMQKNGNNIYNMYKEKVIYTLKKAIKKSRYANKTPLFGLMPALKKQHEETGRRCGKRLGNFMKNKKGETTHTACAGCGDDIIVKAIALFVKRKLYCKKCRADREKNWRTTSPKRKEYQKARNFMKFKNDYSLMDAYREKYKNVGTGKEA